MPAVHSGRLLRPDAGQPARRFPPPPDPFGRFCDAGRRCGSAVGLLRARPLDGLQQPFFFLFGPTAALPLHRAKLTDFLVDPDQVLAEFLELMKLGDLLLRFTQRGRVGEGFGHGLTGHSAS
jgi:hypothetical protein